MSNELPVKVYIGTRLGGGAAREPQTERCQYCIGMGQMTQVAPGRAV